MSYRIEEIRAQMRAEAREIERRKQRANMLAEPLRVPAGRGGAAYGEEPCPRCGVRSGVGCKHRRSA